MINLNGKAHLRNIKVCAVYGSFLITLVFPSMCIYVFNDDEFSKQIKFLKDRKAWLLQAFLTNEVHLDP
jgi:hypothetical protein